MMNAIQFKAFVRDGLIKIPDEYQEVLNKEVNVIVLLTEDAAKRKQRFFESVKKHSFKLPTDYYC